MTSNMWIRKKTHNLLKPQILLFFSEASEKKRNICGFNKLCATSYSE